MNWILKVKTSLKHEGIDIKLGKKAVSGIMLVLLTIGMLSLAFNIQPAKARTITVPDDYPTIQEAINNANEGDTIFVKNGTYKENVVVNKEISLFGENRETTIILGITKSRSRTIDVKANNVIINGFTIQTLSGIEFATTGLAVYRCNNTLIQNNIILGNGYGIRLTWSFNITLYGNSIIDNYYGIELVCSSNCTFKDNHINGGQYNFGVKGNELSHFLHDIDSSNAVDDRPIYYWVNRQNDVVPTDAGYVALVRSTNITAKNLNLENNIEGLIIASTNDSIVVNNTVTNSEYTGIHLLWSSDNVIAFNNILSTNIVGHTEGISLFRSFKNRIYKNNITDYCQDGISLDYSTNNIIFRNNVINNRIRSLQDGLQLCNSSNNRICGNNVINNVRALVLAESSNNNTIFHNNFMNNTYEVASGVSINIWDDGYPSGGNYWSNYTGVDLFSGPFQNVTGSDGIGDSPYIVDENNVDRYPLIAPFNSFITSVGYSVDVISNSTVEDFRYFESNSTIVMHVSNMTANQTVGFCRLTIPHNVMSPPYTVKVNDTTIEYQTIYENHTEGISIIYFTYEHSKLEIVITPEYPSMTIMLLLSVTLVTTALTKRKLQRRKCIKEPQT